MYETDVQSCVDNFQDWEDLVHDNIFVIVSSGA